MVRIRLPPAMSPGWFHQTLLFPKHGVSSSPHFSLGGGLVVLNRTSSASLLEGQANLRLLFIAGGRRIRTLGPSREGSAGKVEHLDEVGPSSRTLRERRLPRNMDDRQAMMASLDRLEALERGAHLLRPRSRVLANGAAGADPDRLTLSCAILLVPDDKRNWRIIPPAVLAVVTASGERPRSWTEPRISRARRFAEDSTLEGRGFELLVPPTAI